ncbi:putative membrane protein [Campylobacter blaseri]|uniref:Uroporphyrinogen III synthase HEM4 n=1 Tax=Campylobacter blaseri TaxID=2042961 RepID=A0A2P8QZC2_9BACT|nr:hypothetical protein [Campylobacter blaseri]PSM51583.1 hypothetical protein CQ405_07245 [Campylobacter blaseri]PSM53376.1 hypothetical protein CRN67_07250 [Campylobacter blaseri]QKF86671.1 putative membrane protein [Campylobacter blaseri]
MKLKQFIIYSLIYIGLVGVLVFVQNGTSYTTSILNMELTLPVALWFIIPLILFAIFSVLHILLNELSIFMERKAVRDDAGIYKEYAKEILLGTETDKSFKTDTFKISNEVTKFLSPWHDNPVDIEDKEIVEIIDMLKKINNKEVVDLKKYKLDNSNPIFIKNEFNKLESDNSYALEILKNKKELDDDLSKKAYEILLNSGTYEDIKKLDIEISQDDAKLIVNRYINKDNFILSSDDLYSLIEEIEISKKEYVKLAMDLNKKIEPDILVAMFNRLKNYDEKAMDAYLYLLYEFGMIDELKEIITYKDEGEYEKFEILLFLREAGKQIPASYFFR